VEGMSSREAGVVGTWLLFLVDDGVESLLGLRRSLRRTGMVECLQGVGCPSMWLSWQDDFVLVLQP